MTKIIFFKFLVSPALGVKNLGLVNSGRETLLLKDEMGGQEDGLISCGSCVSLYLRKTFSEFRRWKCARAYRKHVAATSAPLLSVHVSDGIFFRGIFT